VGAIDSYEEFRASLQEQVKDEEVRALVEEFGEVFRTGTSRIAS
jgi:hypothetical protein